MLFWVYMLEINRKEKISYYIGYTSDLAKRIDQHKAGKGAQYTKGNNIIKLVYTEKFNSRSDAMRREIELKKLKKPQKEILARNYSSLPDNFFKIE